MDPLDKGKIHVLGRMDRVGVRFQHAPQDGARLETYEFFMIAKNMELS